MSENEEENKENSKKADRAAFPTLSHIDSVEEIGTQIGSYKLLSVLGEGGFGIVYLAEQKEPVRRQVALKVIKPGMDSKQVTARFESERQALALLDHPNIARVFDGGTTGSGRPYFVMEYIKGKSITEHCDRKKLSIEERLRLFLQVCEAVQHAHQRGIIHRDIKPSNILVSVQDDMATPKVIDFGVAKAISQPLTERTLFTEQGQLLGTPEYMSPEQADLTPHAVDTRSDIYSLGVVLYELLTGALPFDSASLRQVAIDEILRTIRDDDPPRPSTRLSSLGDDAGKAAQNRRTAVRALTKRLHRELEWIPLKAMRKEPDRRYRTATEFADDIRHYLNGDALVAGPESVTYQLRKLIARHKYASAVVGLLFVIVLSFCYVSLDLYLTAKEAEENSEATAQEMTNLAIEHAKSAREIAFMLFLQAWHENRPQLGNFIAGFISADGEFPEAAAIPFLLDPNSAVDKESEIRAALGKCPGYADFVLGECYLKSGDAKNALDAYEQCRQVIWNDKDSQLTERGWFMVQLRTRIDELRAAAKPPEGGTSNREGDSREGTSLSEKN
jgi:serine/threonine protein kinase